jgi:hypothetical protein
MIAHAKIAVATPLNGSIATRSCSVASKPFADGGGYAVRGIGNGIYSCERISHNAGKTGWFIVPRK